MNLKPLLFALLTLAPVASPASDTDAVRDALDRFVADWPRDPMFREGTFGIRVGEAGDWHVTAVAGGDGDDHEATLAPGLPEQPAWFFTIDTPGTLARLDRGDLAPGTAAVKAFSTDFAPMDVDFTEGFQPDEGFAGGMLQTLFHFWNRGTPEITRFNAANTRESHGTDVVVLYYQPGLRSGWFSIKPGDHVNENPDSRENPFPTLLVITRGQGIARLDGEDHAVGEGQSLYIPAGMSHEFLNPGELPMEGVLLMFGEGALGAREPVRRRIHRCSLAFAATGPATCWWNWP